jgi:hypothetical protein
MNDITRLLSLDFNDLAGELGHSPEEAKAIVDSAIINNPPTCIEDIAEGVSQSVNSSISKSGSVSDYTLEELKLITDEIKDKI